MEILNIIKEKLGTQIIFAIIVVIISFILNIILKKIINKSLKRIKQTNEKSFKRKTTYLRVLDSTVKYLIVIIDILLILQIYKINVTSIIAGLGIVSVITGLALQDALKDIIAGFNILFDGYFSVGDVIKIGSFEGKIIEVNFKVSKLRDINTKDVLVIANRNIVEALNVSKEFDIDIPIGYDEKITKIESVIKEIITEASKIEKIEDIKYMGVNEFADSSIKYKIRVWCDQELKPQIKRDLLRMIKVKLDENSIIIPFNQIDIHQK